MAEVYNPRKTLDAHSGNISEAASAFYKIIERGVREHRKVHIETAISAAGYVAGTTLLRGSGVDLKGMKVGGSANVENIERSCVRLIEFMQGLCAEASIGRDGGWLDPLPKDHRATRKMIDLVTEFEPKFLGVVMEFGIDQNLRPGVAASTAVQFIREFRVELPVDIGKALAAHSIVHAARTVPPPVKAAVSYNRNKPWWKLW